MIGQSYDDKCANIYVNTSGIIHKPLVNVDHIWFKLTQMHVHIKEKLC